VSQAWKRLNATDNKESNHFFFKLTEYVKFYAFSTRTQFFRDALAITNSLTMAGGAIKKAGETAVKKVGKAAQTSLKEARSVTAKEAPSIAPAKESTKESMMPWRGWLTKALSDRFGEERVEEWRRKLVYKPDDVHDFNQIPKPSTKVPITKDGKETAMFRYPSPGSQDPVRIPKGFEPDEDPYDTSYYKRDTARRYRDSDFSNQEKAKLELMNSNDPDVQKLREELAAGPESSPGNQGRFATGPSDFDPTGLRATMSTTNEALEASLDANMPDHLPDPEWFSRSDEIIAWYQERGLPVPAGGTGFGTVPTHRRIAKW